MHFKLGQKIIDKIRGKNYTKDKVKNLSIDNKINIAKGNENHICFDVVGKNNEIFIPSVLKNNANIHIRIFGDNNKVIIKDNFKLSGHLLIVIGQDHKNFGKVTNSEFIIDENTGIEAMEYVNKSRVLNFVSYVNPNIYDISENVAKIIKEKYNLPIKYFYLPNQFWQHKNHIIVFKAINYLKQKGINIQLICSGYMQDYRNKDYLDNVLLKYIKENHLENNIHFLGVIPLDDVFYLMRNCVSIINPSLFEGWSSTVEEAKSMGKNMILSDLNVHKEQNPPESKFFKREDFIDLANIMQSDWENLNSEPNYALENSARTNLNKRMIEFGKNYLNIVKELI